MPRALISVYDKTNVVEFASDLIALGWDIVASGGTERALSEAGLDVTPVESLTGLPEMLDGRVKTLHPAIHAGILARATQQDLDDLNDNGFAPIKMVVCNLYPFQQTIARANTTLQDAVEQIDIGGVTLIRAAAKNFFHVTCVCHPDDYGRVSSALKASGDVDLALKRELAVKAFAHTRDYDTAIHAYLATGAQSAPAVSDELPSQMSLALHRVDVLRYGENPHQKAAFYAPRMGDTPFGGKVLGGKALSYNNLLDLDAAWRAVSMFTEPTVVIVKHLTPTGIASADDISEAYPRALASDPVSAFGGVIAVNRPVDDNFVESLGALFVEAIAAPAFTETAQSTLSEKRRNCRLIRITQPFDGSELEVRNIHRGFLVQRPDVGDPEGTLMTTVTQRAPDANELEALQFAWKAVQHVKSNAIVLAKAGATVGIGGGLPSRVDAVNLAVKKAGENGRGAVLASDAFFPFADGVVAASNAGITAIIQPGGSIRDNEVIEAADKAGIAMVTTKTRHFRH
ncbi:MAG: bifunctional phosphoribosylaminoimidazolecarboxamide formyltransferase/IMP cyclohydrolase PurH [Anaerolineaceae bacterium]|nr:MAG: bifunctional phosphoribosylaminoimidazolecarboxamide formyltransferase/IMP cyclohydrolase PurH [Anaerolineaceae bacterium]